MPIRRRSSQKKAAVEILGVLSPPGGDIHARTRKQEREKGMKNEIYLVVISPVGVFFASLVSDKGGQLLHSPEFVQDLSAMPFV